MQGQYMKNQKHYPEYKTGVKEQEQTTEKGEWWSQGWPLSKEARSLTQHLRWAVLLCQWNSFMKSPVLQKSSPSEILRC